MQVHNPVHYPVFLTSHLCSRADFKNVSIVAHYIKERTKNAQFVIISLRNNMFELADRLVREFKHPVTLIVVCSYNAELKEDVREVLLPGSKGIISGKDCARRRMQQAVCARRLMHARPAAMLKACFGRDG